MNIRQALQEPLWAAQRRSHEVAQASCSTAMIPMLSRADPFCPAVKPNGKVFYLRPG
ncbi:MAG: hypothetical protein A07HR60_02678 [uncultured archaeon A07HR60]|nr:MAG: hypothetical protein A07HR60_02678 [uncultured archaeon A07HR60]